MGLDRPAQFGLGRDKLMLTEGQQMQKYMTLDDGGTSSHIRFFGTWC